MRFRKSARVIAVFFLCCLFVVSHTLADSTQCLKCHQKTIDAAAIKLIIHPPFSQHKCPLCHTANPGRDVITETTEVEDLANDSGHMEWIAESFHESTLQVALLPADICTSDLTLKLWYQNREKQQSKLRCPAVETIPAKTTAASPPTISQLQLHNYNDQLFTRATVYWTTNVPCRCQLIYHSDKHAYTEHEDDFYTVTHNQEIRNFNPANTRVSIQCDDTLKQHARVPLTPLSQLSRQNTETNSLSLKEPAEFSIDFKRINDQIEISITTNQPAALALGRTEQPRITATTPEVPQVSEIFSPERETPVEHPPLSDKKQVNTTICFQCHKETVEVASHPINVTAPPGMIIPPEYPLLSDGRITCMTCHSPHSSDNEARLIKEGKKELCIGCHTNY